jgi:prolipoprotein diacylglyceryl transferase
MLRKKGLVNKMKNELLKIGPFVVHGYGLMIAIGIMAAYLSVEYRAKLKGLKHELIFNLTIWCALGGILGAKLLYIFTQLKSIIADPSSLLQVSEGFVVYGGIIGGIFAGYLFTVKHKLNFLEYFDIVMPSIALAQGFGRIGCLLAGCCYGMETKSPFNLVFTHSDFAPNGIHLLPTQPISSILDFLNCAVLILISRRTKAHGQVAGFYLIFYSAGRFILEFFRGDLERGQIGILSTSQFISIWLFLFGIALVIICGFKAKKVSDPEAIPAESEENKSNDENLQ